MTYRPRETSTTSTYHKVMSILGSVIGFTLLFVFVMAAISSAYHEMHYTPAHIPFQKGEIAQLRLTKENVMVTKAGRDYCNDREGCRLFVRMPNGHEEVIHDFELQKQNIN